MYIVSINIFYIYIYTYIIFHIYNIIPENLLISSVNIVHSKEANYFLREYDVSFDNIMFRESESLPSQDVVVVGNIFPR